jgi:hypothetical protein
MQPPPFRPGPEQWRLRSTGFLVAMGVIAVVLLVLAVAVVVSTPLDSGPRWARSPASRALALVTLGVIVGAGLLQFLARTTLLRRVRARRPEAIPFATGAATTRQFADLLGAWLGKRPSHFGRMPVVVAVADGIEIWWRNPDRPEVAFPWQGMWAYASGTSQTSQKRWNVIVVGVPGVPVPLELLVGGGRERAERLWHAVTAGIDGAAVQPPSWSPSAQ